MKIAVVGSRGFSVDNLEKYLPEEVIAFWDGRSKGTKYVIEQCRKKNKKVTVIKLPEIG